MQKIFTVILISSSITCFAQEGEKALFNLAVYLEIYYLYDFDKPENHTRPDFIYSYNRSNEVNLNLGFIKGSYSSGRLRANLAFMTGMYTNANMKNESGALKNIFEANTGIKLSKSRNLWIDAGILLHTLDSKAYW